MADVIPSSRRVDWIPGTTVGVKGGFEQYSNSWNVVPITGLDNTGIADCSGAIQSAINSAPDGTILTVGAGEFRLNNGLSLGLTRDFIVLRGAGSANTIFKAYGAAAIGTGGQSTSFTYPAGVTLTASASKGSSAVTVSDGSGFAATGLQIFLQPDNDSSVPVISTSAYQGSRSFLAVITGTSGNVVSFEPPLPFDMPAGTKAFRETGNSVRASSFLVGVEKFTIDMTNSSNVNGLGMFAVRQNWAYDINVLNVANYNISHGQSTFCTIQKCRISGVQNPDAGTSRNGYICGNCTGLLFQDNIAVNHVSAFEMNAGSSYCVFAYNYFQNLHVHETIGSAFNINHGPHNSFNLYEGNLVPRIQSDGYFGSSSNETLFRNWFHGTNGADTASVYFNKFAVTLNRFTRQFNVVGNWLGRSDLGITWARMNIAKGFDTTSTTSLTPALGAISVTIGTGLSYNDNGTSAIFYSSSTPSAWMSGRITGYNSSTGAATLTRYTFGGSGTHTDWVVIGGGGYGDDTTHGYCMALGCPNIGNGGFFGDQSVCAPQSHNIWWRVWGGNTMTRKGDFDGSTVYSVGDVVNLYGNGPNSTTGGNGILQWLASNSAKNGTATWATPSDSQNDWQPISSNSFQELDYDVYSTMLLKGNWNAATDTIASDEALSVGETYPDSYYLSGKPTWFGTMSWPPVDATTPPADQSTPASLVLIPAAWREINGNEDYVVGGGSETGPATADPIFAPVAGVYSSAQSIIISCSTPSSHIRYTTDGSFPTSTTGTIYTVPFTVSSTTTVRAIAYSTGYTDSNVRTAAYTIVADVVATPTFSPTGGSFNAPQSVAISTLTSGATIRYTTDGSIPTQTHGTVYATPVSISTSTTFKAIGYKSGVTDSNVSSASYTLKASKPGISTAPGQKKKLH